MNAAAQLKQDDARRLPRVQRELRGTGAAAQLKGVVGDATVHANGQFPRREFRGSIEGRRGRGRRRSHPWISAARMPRLN